MAQVWEAIDRRLDRPVAVKLFAGEAAHEALRARSLHEARLAAQFAHSHAVMVYDIGEDGRVVYLVMELDKVQKLGRETGAKQAKEARKRMDDVVKWAEKGELDAEIARLAIVVLEPLATPPDEHS